MLDHGAAGLLNRGTGPAAVEAGEEPAGKGSRPALPTSLRRNYIHATPILRGLGCNCNVAKPSGQRSAPDIGSSSGVATTASQPGPESREACGLLCYHVLSMSITVGIRELRQQASAILKRVVAGEAIVVTEHGHPIARIVPLRPSQLEQLMIEGRATEAEGNLIDVLDEMGLPAEPTGNILPSAALAELRADER
jgi:prevent-host-death family protein